MSNGHPTTYDTGDQLSRSHVEYVDDCKLIITQFQCGCRGTGGKYVVLYKPCNKHSEPKLPEVKINYPEEKVSERIPLGALIPPEGVWINVPIPDDSMDDTQKQKEYEVIKKYKY